MPSFSWIVFRRRGTTHCFLNRHRGVNPVLVIEIDVVQAEALQAGLTGCAHVFRSTFDDQSGVIELRNPTLGGQLNLFSGQLLQGLMQREQESTPSSPPRRPNREWERQRRRIRFSVPCRGESHS